MVNNERMTPKNYEKTQKTYMAFGSIMNGLQHYIANEKEEAIGQIINNAFEQAKKLTSDLVDDMYKIEVFKKDEEIKVEGTKETIKKDDIPF